MAKTTIQLANGTLITVEGSVEEVAKIVNIYEQGQPPHNKQEKIRRTRVKDGNVPSGANLKGGEVNILEVVNATKEADDFDQIEKNILDQASQVDRVLLPLFIADRSFGTSCTFTSNDVYIYLKDFGINMALPNISKTLNKTAVKYVMKVSSKKRGVFYRISRPGKQHIEKIISP